MSNVAIERKVRPDLREPVEGEIIPAYPPAPPGKVFRLVRVLLDGQPDMRNINQRKAQGWVFVKPGDPLLKGTQWADLTNAHVDGFITLGDLALAMNTVERNDNYKRQTQLKTRNQRAAVRANFAREGNHLAPVYDESRSTVQIVGNGRTTEFVEEAR